MRDEKEGGKQQGQTNNKVKQHSTPKAVTFPKKNELPRYIYTYTLYILDFSQHDTNIHHTHKHYDIVIIYAYPIAKRWIS